MNDKELLMMAAKTAGISKQWDGSLVDRVFPDRVWNPLSDDGDALRLAVKLRLFVTVGANNIEARRWSGADVECMELCCCIEAQGADPYAATRRAIVRAAAELGSKL